MATLIDNYKDVVELVGDKEFIIKPLYDKCKYKSLWTRIKDAIGVLTCRYTAVYFLDDQIRKDLK